MEKLSIKELEALYTHDKKKFDEYSLYYYNNDRSYYNQVVKPIIKGSANVKKSKRTAFIIAICVLIGLIICCILLSRNTDTNKKTVTDLKKENKNEDSIDETLKEYGSDWETQFINYRMKHNKDLEKLIIDGSVLYIYVRNITDDITVYSKMYTLQFQKVYHENTGGSNVGSLVYYGNRLLYKFDANNDGLK